MRWMSEEGLFRMRCGLRTKIRRSGSLGNGSHRVESDLGGGAEGANTCLDDIKWGGVAESEANQTT